METFAFLHQKTDGFDHNKESVYGRGLFARGLCDPFGDKEGLITFYGNDGSAASATADVPWKKDKGYTGEATTELAGPVSIEPGKKIYIFVHQMHKGDEMVTVTPGDVQNDPESLKSTDKVYAYYVIFEHSKEYER